jgi:asparagine synthase (glutamine-hydrolysing)
VWSVLARTLRRKRLAHSDHRKLEKMREARQLVRKEVREPFLMDPGAILHPWFRSGHVPAGAREILAFLTGPEEFYDPISSPEDAPADSIFPLLSQPLVELCMRIPSYVHFDQGRDRGLARSAFVGDVPAPILQRTWKDRVQGFPEELLHNHLSSFRSLLLDGLLVQRGYLDQDRVEDSLNGNALQANASVGEIIDHVLVESWLRSWEQRIRFE